MKKRSFKRWISLLLAVAMLVVCLSGCHLLEPEELQPMSFAYTLVEQDTQDALDLADEVDACIDGKKFFKLFSALNKLMDKRDYIYHQYLVAQVKYYADLEDGEAYEMYVAGEEAYMQVQEASLNVMKKLYKSDLLAKKLVFAGWTEAQTMRLEASGGEALALEQEQNELVREYLSLDEPGSAAWSDDVADIYYTFVDRGRQLAKIYGYDNYYAYAAAELYMRTYTKEQREAVRQNVKDTLLPFYREVSERYQQQLDRLTDEQREQLTALRQDTCLPTNEYLTGYIGSYPEAMQTVMNHLFDRDALVYTESEHAHSVAYTQYSDYAEQPYVFLGNGVQDLLTLVHEQGHYTAYYHFSDADLPYDTAEVHSQGNEWLMMQYLDGKLDEDVYEAFLLRRLRNGLDVIILSTVVDEFEETVYTAEQAVRPEDYRTVLNTVLDGYDGVEALGDRDELYVYTQYVTIESPVYYLSYATSELAAMSFYTLAEEKGYAAAQDVYVDLCMETPTGATFFETLSDVGLPNPFEADTVTRLVDAFASVTEENVMAAAA